MAKNKNRKSSFWLAAGTLAIAATGMAEPVMAQRGDYPNAERRGDEGRPQGGDRQRGGRPQGERPQGQPGARPEGPREGPRGPGGPGERPQGQPGVRQEGPRGGPGGFGGPGERPQGQPGVRPGQPRTIEVSPVRPGAVPPGANRPGRPVPPQAGPGRPGPNQRWDRNDWRRNDRYNWQHFRARNHGIYRPGPYYAPYRHYSYRRIGIGFSLGALFYSDRYWIDDPYYYRLPPVYGPYRWVRYYDDVLLVNIYTGEVVDVIYDFFW